MVYGLGVPDGGLACGVPGGVVAGGLVAELGCEDVGDALFGGGGESAVGVAVVGLFVGGDVVLVDGVAADAGVSVGVDPFDVAGCGAWLH